MTRLHVTKQPLIILAGIVWLIAGVNVAQLGVSAAIGMHGVTTIIVLALVGGAGAIFCAFHSMFSKLVKKNAQRIADLEGERHLVFRFFDRKSYVMMALMMSFGIGMRVAVSSPTGSPPSSTRAWAWRSHSRAPATSCAALAAERGRFTGVTESRSALGTDPTTDVGGRESA